MRTPEQAKRIMEQRGHSKCTGIRVIGGKVYSSPCGTNKCGSCTKANGRRLYVSIFVCYSRRFIHRHLWLRCINSRCNARRCPGEGCDKWISVSAKQHNECGWRKPEQEKKPAAKEYMYRADDHHGFEKVKRKMLALVSARGRFHDFSQFYNVHDSHDVGSSGCTAVWMGRRNYGICCKGRTWRLHRTYYIRKPPERAV